MDVGTFSYNGISSENFGITAVTKVVRPITPATRERTVMIPHRDGVIDYGRDYNALSIDVEFVILASTIEQRQIQARQIAAWLAMPDARELKFADEPDKYYLARPIGAVNLSYVSTIGMASVTFLVPDAVAHKTETTTVETTGGELVAWNAGTIATPIHMQATLQESASVLRLDLTETEFTEIEYEFENGDEVTIDGNTRQILLNDDVDLRPYETLASRIYTLPTPLGKINPTPESTHLSVTYRERYR